MRYLNNTDPKISRIRNSWFVPSLRQAAWLASIADEIGADGRGNSTSAEFVHLSLAPAGHDDPASALVIPTSHIGLVIERIPVLERSLTRIALAA